MANISQGDGDIGFQIAPMVDVVFVLVLFFMASAGMQQTENFLPVNVPAKAEGGSDAAPTPHFVEITPAGAVVINDQQVAQPGDVEMPGVVQKLKEIMATSNSEDVIIIRPADDTIHDRVVDVLNAAAEAEVKNLTFS